MKKSKLKTFTFLIFFFHYIDKFVKKIEGGSTKAVFFLENLKNLLLKNLLVDFF